MQLADSHVGKLGGEPPEPGDDLLLVIRSPDLSHLVVIEASRFDRGLPAPEISVRRGGKPHIDPRVRDRLSGSMKRVDLIDDSRGVPRLRLTWFHHGLRNTGERASPHDAADVIRLRARDRLMSHLAAHGTGVAGYLIRCPGVTDPQRRGMSWRMALRARDNGPRDARRLRPTIAGGSTQTRTVGGTTRRILRVVQPSEVLVD